ncbi:MAG: DNA polymerase V [Burkholderiaceae bacterium]|jgi:DNA polymerase V
MILQGISDASGQQQSLFTTYGDGANSVAMMRTPDGLNQRFGKGPVTIAVSGTRNDWTMKREKKMPNYTTSWKELPVARAN